MSDFGAGACDFHSDFASDFRTEANDYASDFRDFPGDFAGDFAGDFGGRATHGEAAAGGHRDRPAGAGDSHRQGHRGTRTPASWQRKRKATAQATTPRNRAANRGHRASRTAAV